MLENKWALYDCLIEGVSPDLKLEQIEQTHYWTLISNGQSIGTAMNFHQDNLDFKKYQGANLQEVASLIKSWDFAQASLGLAAINSYYNQPHLLEKQFNPAQITEEDAFIGLENLEASKKYAMIGHFPYIDHHPEKRAQVTVFELNPKVGDVPASAAEFLLPEMDYLYLTASAIVNKTLPRLLELAPQAKKILLGSSCPLSRCLFEIGCESLGGTLYHHPLSELVAQKKKEHRALSKLGTPLLISRVPIR